MRVRRPRRPEPGYPLPLEKGDDGPVGRLGRTQNVGDVLVDPVPDTVDQGESLKPFEFRSRHWADLIRLAIATWPDVAEAVHVLSRGLIAGAIDRDAVVDDEAACGQTPKEMESAALRTSQLYRIAFLAVEL